MIIQLDSLLNLMCKDSDVVDGEGVELAYDLKVLDESESLMFHFDK